jgi:hypothetical protein
MSIKVMSLVWEKFPEGGSDMLVMLAMADWCNDEGLSLHPSHAAVAKKCRMSRVQAQRIVKSLVDNGWLDVIGNQFGGAPGTTKKYRLNVEKLRADDGYQDDTGITSDTGITEDTGITQVRDGYHPGASTGITGDTQTTIEPSRTTSNKSCAPATRLPEDWIPSNEDVQFCKTTRPDLDPFAVADGFRDYWIAVPGARGKKASWPATWRNWVRNQKQTQGRYESEKDRSRREFAQAIFGKGKHEQHDERDITSFAERLD